MAFLESNSKEKNENKTAEKIGRDRDVPEYISRLNVNRRCHYLHFTIGSSYGSVAAAVPPLIV